MTYRPLEHTADLGIEAEADSLEELFVECLRAQTDCLTRLDRVETTESHPVKMAAPDLPQLLVDFLTEAIYLFETQELVLSDADVRLQEDRVGWTLSGTMAGERFELSRHGLKTLLKAVTYHQLSVQRHDSGWAARVIFDI